jgi:hypothetical protein
MMARKKDRLARITKYQKISEARVGPVLIVRLLDSSVNQARSACWRWRAVPALGAACAAGVVQEIA